MSETRSPHSKLTFHCNQIVITASPMDWNFNLKFNNRLIHSIAFFTQTHPKNVGFNWIGNCWRVEYRNSFAHTLYMDFQWKLRTPMHLLELIIHILWFWLASLHKYDKLLLIHINRALNAELLIAFPRKLLLVEYKMCDLSVDWKLSQISSKSFRNLNPIQSLTELHAIYGS